MTLKCSREELFARFEALNIETETHEHPPIMTVEEGYAVWEGIAGVHCKNLFLKDAKKAYWLVVAPAERAIDLKTLNALIGAKRLSFARPERLREVLAVEPGSVTPFALINDDVAQVNVVLDKWMVEQDVLNFHPLENTATTSISANNLIRFIESCGHEPLVIDLERVPESEA